MLAPVFLYSFFIIYLQTQIVCNAKTLGTTSASAIKLLKERPTGYECPLRNHPYMVTVRTAKDFKHRCAGTIISQFWVLTAAQCGYQGSLIVFAGATTIYKKINHVLDDDIQWALVEKIYVHRHFDARTLRNDIALMELNYPIKETATVQFSNLADYLRIIGRSLQKICEHGMVVGWQERNIVNDTQNQIQLHVLSLQCINLTVTDYNECRQIYEKDVPDTMVCAFTKGVLAYEDFIFQGFLGGPLICMGVQYGLISTGTGYTKRNSPDLYTRIGLYENFIHKVIVKTSGTECLRFNHLCCFILYVLYIYLSIG